MEGVRRFLRGPRIAGAVQASITDSRTQRQLAEPMARRILEGKAGPANRSRARPPRLAVANRREVVEPLRPTVEAKETGRPRVPDRVAFNAIVFVLVTGIAWRFVPPRARLLGGDRMAAPSRLAGRRSVGAPARGAARAAERRRGDRLWAPTTTSTTRSTPA